MSGPIQRRLAAILAADVAGYSRLVRADEEGTLARLRALRRELIDPTIAAHHGRIVKTTGDGILIEFVSIVDAVRCAVAAQCGIASRNRATHPEKRIEFRMGLNVGDVVVDGDDLLGDGVNVAARLEGLSEPNGICLSDAAYQHVRDKLDHEFVDCGEQRLKNIERPVRVYRVSLDGSRVPAASHEEPQYPTEALAMSATSLSQQARAMDGAARFRDRGQPIGMSGNGKPIQLEVGSALWLRLVPSRIRTKTWSPTELKEMTCRPDSHLAPLGGEAYGGEFRYAMATDGIGIYAHVGNEQIAKAVVFVFATGEIWAIDAGRIEAARMIPYCERLFVNAIKHYARFLQDQLRLRGPYRWIAGVEGVKGRPIELPRTGARGSCLSDVIEDTGIDDGGMTFDGGLHSFFVKLHACCQIERPGWMDNLLSEEAR